MAIQIDLAGRVAIVTGGYGSIGSAMCKRLAEAGAAVVPVGRSAEKGAAFEEELRQLGANVMFVQGDTVNKQSMQNLCRTVIDHFGGVDILVNNAGFNTHSEGRLPIHEYRDKDWLEIVEANLTGFYYCSKPVIEHMKERKYGRIINISSIVGSVPLRNQCAYASAKGGVNTLTKAMALELAPYNILVNCISPGSVVNEHTQKMFYSNKETYERFMSHVPLGRPGRPEEIAGATVFLASDEVTYMTGNIVTIDGGWTCGYARDF